MFVVLIVALYVPSIFTTGLFNLRLRKLGRRINRLNTIAEDPDSDEVRKIKARKERDRSLADWKTQVLYYRSLWTNRLVFFLLIVVWFPF